MSAKPNFFILGAPKCGTTSLALWLSAHPSIYMSPEKEPEFFNEDHRRRGHRSRIKYETLFARAGPQYAAIGEASAWYLYSGVAVPSILKFAPDARFICMLRSPVQMAPSLHAELLFQGVEHVNHFEAAWRLQDSRLKGANLTGGCIEPAFLLYGRTCSLGDQMQRLYSRVPRERVHAIILDDVKRDPRNEYLRVLSFLGVKDDGRQAFPVENIAKAPRPSAVDVGIQLAAALKSSLGFPWNFGTLRAADRLSRVRRPWAPLRPEFEAELSAYFRRDVELLGELLGRDLSHWVK